MNTGPGSGSGATQLPELPAGSRRLVIMRHAKAEGFAADDHSRVLTDRGRRDALAAGLWLAAQGVVPEHAFVSSAARTVGTWEGVATGSRCAAEVDFQDALYSASPESAMDILTTAPLDANVVMFVGHNPTTAYVAHLLDNGTPDEAAWRDMSEGYPTAAITIVDLEVPWAELAPGTGHIAAFHVGDGSAVNPRAGEPGW